MGKAKRVLRLILLAVFPTRLVRPIVNRLGCDIAKGARVGFSVINVRALKMAEGARIGHLNFLSGDFTIDLGVNAAIGHTNQASRAKFEDPSDDVVLRLGIWSKITARHRVDLTKSVTLGDYSTIAGHACQLWTHGYIHEQEGLARYRIDGPIEIGDNVYIGTASIISMGVRIGDGVIVGAGSSVAKSLLEPGLYVSSPLRQLPRPANPGSRADLVPVPDHSSGDVVYRKVP